MGGYLKRMVDAIERGRRFVTRDVWQLGRPGERLPSGFVIKHARVAVLVVTGFVKDDLLMRASALTFASMLSLVPILAVMFWIINAFNLERNVYTYLYTVTEKAVTALPLTGTPGAPPTTAPAPPDGTTQQHLEDSRLREALVGLFFGDNGTRNLPPGVAEYRDPVEYVVGYAERTAHSNTLGVSGLVLILVTVFGLMSNIEFAFNRIWGLSNRRSWFRTFTDYTMVTLVLPIVAAGALGVAAVLSSATLQAQLGHLSILLIAPQIAVMAIALACLYKFVPATSVRLTYALTGGLGAAVLLYLVTKGYLHSQGLLARYSILYSSFAQIPLLLLWIFMAWVVVLLGAELTFAYQNEQTFAIERYARRASHAYREAVALRAMVDIGQRFEGAEPGLDASTAAQAWNVPLRLLNETLDQLEAANLLRRCMTDPVTYQPACPIARITLHDIRTAIRNAGEDPSPLREDPALQPLLDSPDTVTLEAALSHLEAREM